MKVNLRFTLAILSAAVATQATAQSVHIAFVCGTNPTHVCVMNQDGSNVSEISGTGDLTVGGGSPRWSQDGTRIAFIKGGSPNMLGVMNADGSNIQYLVSSDPNVASLGRASWSPDGSKIAFFKIHADNMGAVDVSATQIFVVNVANGMVSQLTNDSAAAEYPAWSPDGTQIVYNTVVGGVNGGLKLTKINADGSNPKQFGVQGAFASWSRDGSQIAYSFNGTIFAMKSDGSSVRTVTSGTNNNAFFPTWSPDGSQIAYSIFTLGGIAVVSSGGGASSFIRSSNGGAPDWQPSQTAPLGASITQVDTTKCPSTTLLVSVANSSGVAVSGLTANNFALQEDGQTRTVTVMQIGSGTQTSYQVTYVTANRTLDHSITLTVTQGSNSVMLTHMISACCPMPVAPSPGPDSTPPFGSFDTPVDKTTGVVGAIPVTGWALDNVGVTKVEIYRDPIGSEPKGNFGLVFIGIASLVKGARPDVQAAFPTYPNADRAGWGYLLLTNVLPNTNGTSGVGNGTYRLHAIAYDPTGNTTELSAPGKTFTSDNAHAAKPFGTIDTPEQGGVASGTQYINFGWALTPGANITIPTDGSTITVVIDGQTVGHPSYNHFRSDLAALFPGYTNTNGPVGFFPFDTTQFPGCTHTIFWLVYDNAGRGEGIGSRFFTIQGAPPPPAPEALPEGSADHAVTLRRTADAGAAAEILQPDDDGAYVIEVEELGHVELDAGAIGGYLQVGEERQNLPVGSSLKGGVFYWQLGPGFVSEYRIVLLRASGEQIRVRIRVRLKTFSGDDIAARQSRAIQF